MSKSKNDAQAPRKPWMKFYPADWQSEPCLRLCSMAARGLWIECIAIMHWSPRYGHLLVNGKPPTDAELAKLVSESDPKTIAVLIGELVEKGVCDRSSDGVIASRRMIRDDQKYKKAAKNGKKGGNPSLSKNNGIPPPDNPPLKAQVKGGVKLEARSQKLEARQQQAAVAEASEERPPPDLGAVDRIRRAVWLASGKGADWIETQLASAAREGIDQAAAWLAKGLSEAAIIERVGAVFERARAKGERIAKPWAYLDPVMADLAEQPKPPAERDVVADPWEERVVRFRSDGFWLDRWGAPPNDPGCAAPRLVLVRHGFGGADGQSAAA